MLCDVGGEQRGEAAEEARLVAEVSRPGTDLWSFGTAADG
jgi:hypothetical protein